MTSRSTQPFTLRAIFARPTALTWATSVIVWSVVAILVGLVRYARFSNDAPLPLWQAIAYSLSDEIIWILITPYLYAVAKVFRIRRSHWKQSLAAQLGLSLGAQLAISLLVPAIYYFPSREATQALVGLFAEGQWHWETDRLEFFGSYLNNLLVCWVVIAISHGVLEFWDARQRELRASLLEAQLARAELQMLRMQLDPHFLFNTLHAISTLMHRDVEAADRMISLLSDLLRHSLHGEPEQEVPLERELDFLERYLAIEKIRFQERLGVELSIDHETRAALVPSLVLHPLVENAIRHGIARRASAGRLGIRAQRSNGTLSLEVWDDGPGFDAQANAGARNGIGIANTRARLAQLYGDAQAVDVRARESGGVRVTLTIPFRTTLVPGTT